VIFMLDVDKMILGSSLNKLHLMLNSYLEVFYSSVNTIIFYNI
jgi:hypothetical protein